jgi:hypothetical protein
MNKLQKKTTEQVTYILTFDDILPTGITISSIDSITTDLTYSSEQILSIETGNTPVGRGISITLSEGLDGYEHVIVIIIIGSDLLEYEVRATLVISDSAITNDTLYYGSVWEGNDYFKNRLNSDAWDDATNPQKRAALVEATQLIDRLNFRGSKAVATQTLQFPRGEDTEEPDAIKYATYELALQLLDGVNVDYEHLNLQISEDRYAMVRTVRDTEWGPEYIQAGIPSVRAWHLLKPFLRDGRRIRLSKG